MNNKMRGARVLQTRSNGFANHLNGHQLSAAWQQEFRKHHFTLTTVHKHLFVLKSFYCCILIVVNYFNYIAEYNTRIVPDLRLFPKAMPVRKTGAPQSLTTTAKESYASAQVTGL